MPKPVPLAGPPWECHVMLAKATSPPSSASCDILRKLAVCVKEKESDSEKETQTAG